jgi:hypothetical protein
MTGGIKPLASRVEDVVKKDVKKDVKKGSSSDSE